MNINRFIVPAGLAAALHTGLLLYAPDLKPTFIAIVRPTGHEIDPPPPLPPIPEEPRKQAAEEPVAPVRHGTENAEILEAPAEIRPEAVAVDLPPAPVHPGQTTNIIGAPGQIDGIGTEPTGPLTTSIIPVGDLDRIPRTTAQIPPSYPTALRAAGIGGEVLVEFTVDTNGRVVSASVKKSSHREFEEPTLRAVLKWRFEPGKRNGRPVPFRMIIPVDFSVDRS